MHKRKFLDDLQYEYIVPITENNYGEDNPENTAKWEKECSEYGFDSRETWNLDIVMIEKLYERLKLYMEVSIVDLDYHTIKINNENKSLYEWLIILIALCEDVLNEKVEYGNFAWYKKELSESYDVNIQFKDKPDGTIEVIRDNYTAETYWLKSLEANVDYDIDESKKDIWIIWAHINNLVWW